MLYRHCFQICFTVRHSEGSGTPGWLEIKWHTSVSADDVKILGGSIHTIKGNAEALVLASKQIGVEVSADTTKYMAMSRDQNAGRSHNI